LIEPVSDASYVPQSVQALWRELERRKALVRLGPAPQFDRAEQALALFSLAIMLD
jgi:hypothetical protein